MVSDDHVEVTLGPGVHLPPGNAPLAEGTIVSLPAALAAELVAQGAAVFTAAPTTA